MNFKKLTIHSAIACTFLGSMACLASNPIEGQAITEAQYKKYDKINHQMNKVMNTQSRKQKCASTDVWNYTGAGATYLLTRTPDGFINASNYTNYSGVKNQIIGGGVYYTAKNKQIGFLLAENSNWFGYQMINYDFVKSNTTSTKYIWCTNGNVYEYKGKNLNGTSGIFGLMDDYGASYLDYVKDDSPLWKHTSNLELQKAFEKYSGLKPKEPKSKDCDRIISARGKVTLYKNKFATSKKGTTNDASTYRATSYYNYNGKMYYSVYQRDAKGKFTWKGYVEAKKMKTVKGTSINKDFVVTKGNYGVYRDLYRTKKVADSKKYLNKTVRIKKSYQLSDGRKYQEAYYKGKFIGFIGSGALKAK